MRAFSERELQALIVLLGDDDGPTAAVVRGALLEAGEAARPHLEEAQQSADAQVRGRARLLMEELRLAELGRRVAEYAALDDERMDLLEGALLVAEYAHPNVDRTAAHQFIEGAAAMVRARLNHPLGAQDGLAAMTSVLFDRLGFRGGKFADPDESYLNRVIERRTGLPVSLSVAYVLVGQRSGLPVSGVNLPHFFVARYETEDGPVFVDCFQGGRLLSRAGLRGHRDQLSHPVCRGSASAGGPAVHTGEDARQSRERLQGAEGDQSGTGSNTAAVDHFA